MITLVDIFVILLTHWVADFVLQTDWQAKNKSTDNRALVDHVTTYSVCWLVPMFLLFYFGPYNLVGGILTAFVFAILTFFCHLVTDYFTSKINSRLWAKGDVHNFFVSIGFDQVLHYTQLFTLYYLIKTA